VQHAQPALRVMTVAIEPAFDGLVMSGQRFAYGDAAPP
jgi:hypothetical protein